MYQWLLGRYADVTASLDRDAPSGPKTAFRYRLLPSPMAHKEVISVKCPGCGEVLEIDVAREKVMAHRKGPHLLADRKEGEDSLDVAMRNVRDSQRTAS